jgi:hypothetical protein
MDSSRAVRWFDFSTRQFKAAEFWRGTLVRPPGLQLQTRIREFADVKSSGASAKLAASSIQASACYGQRPRCSLRQVHRGKRWERGNGEV